MEKFGEYIGRRYYKDFAKLAPDILDIVLTTLSNPVSGVGMILKKVAQTAASDATIQKNAENEFQLKLDNWVKKEETLSSISRGNISKTINYLTEEINNLAENAIKTNDQVLIAEVFAFYRSAQRKLLTSSNAVQLTREQIAIIKTDLGLLRLKVLWADSQKSALLSQKHLEKELLQEQARQLDIKEKALQIRIFLFFVIYIGGITAAIVFGSKVWSSDTTIPWLGIPISIVFWSAIGSLTNILYKYYKKNDNINIDRELRWIWARPLVGVIMGAVTYLVVASGLILLGAATPQNVSIDVKPAILSLFAFVGSFSDKIFEGVVEKVGLIATNEKNNEEELKNLIEILSGKKIAETDERPK